MALPGNFGLIWANFGFLVTLRVSHDMAVISISSSDVLGHTSDLTLPVRHALIVSKIAVL